MDTLIAIGTALASILQTMGSTVWLPIFIFILAVFFRAKPGRALRAALAIGVGFVGLNLVTSLLMGTLAPAAQAMVTNTGIHLPVIDVGWPVIAGIAFGTVMGALVFPIGIIVNFVILFAGLTKTLDIDLWNYWHWAFVGGSIYAIYHDIGLAVLALIGMEVWCIKSGDWFAHHLWATFPEYSGLTLSHGGTANDSIFAVLIMPWLSRLPLPKSDPESVTKRIGVIGEPAVLGMLIGAGIAILAGYGYVGITQMAITMAAVAMLMPRMIALLMEGLVPISESVKTYMETRFKGRELWIGMDTAICIGHASNVAVSLLLVPTLIVSALVPGNLILPFAGLASTVYSGVMPLNLTKGDILKMWIYCTIAGIISLWMATFWVPFFTATALSTGLVQQGTLVGATFLHWQCIIFYFLFQVPAIGIPVSIVLIGALLIVDRFENLRKLGLKLIPVPK